jgi:hypothetical protein
MRSDVRLRRIWKTEPALKNADRAGRGQLATRILSASGVGRMTAGARPNTAIKAM